MQEEGRRSKEGHGEDAKGEITNKREDRGKTKNQTSQGIDIEATSSNGWSTAASENTAPSTKRQNLKTTHPPSEIAEPTKKSARNRRATLASALGNPKPIKTTDSPKTFSITAPKPETKETTKATLVKRVSFKRWGLNKTP